MSNTEVPKAEPRQGHERPWALWAVVIGSTPFVFAALRLLAFSGGDRVVLVTLVRSLNIPGILISSLAPLALTATVTFLYWYLLGYGIRVRIHRQLRGRPILIIGAALVVLFAVSLMPIVSLLSQFGVYFAITAFFLLVGVVVQRIRKRKVALRKRISAWINDENPTPRPVRYSQTAAVVVLVGLSVLSPQSMWLPKERVSLSNGSSIEGYVVANEQGWMTTISPTRSIRMFKSSEVRSRKVCGQGMYQSLVTLWAGETQSVSTGCK